MIRIAYLIDTISCDTAGTQKQLLETIQRLDQRIFSPHLICLWESDWMKHHVLPCAYTILGYSGFLKADFPGAVLRLRALIRRYRFHIVQTFFEDSIFVGYIGGLIGRPRPVLLSSRRDMGLGVPHQPRYHRLFKLALPLVNKSFAGIVTNSAQIRQYVAAREKTSLSKIKVIHNGIDIPPPSGVTPELLSQNPCDVCLVVVASLTPVKRHDLFLKAFATLKKTVNGVSIKALFLGDGPERTALTQLSEELGLSGDVVFAGAVDNVSEFLQNVDVGVLCSDREGLSNAIMEYMACSLPVIATAVGGNVELVDGANGICTQPGDVESLAKAMQRLVSDPMLRERLGQESFRKLCANYSWSKTMRTMESYYLSLVAGEQKKPRR